MSEELQRRIAALERDLAQLREWVVTGGPRLGPGPESPDDTAARTRRLVELLKKPDDEPPPVDRTNVCTTNGQPVAEVRASQTRETGQHSGYVVLCDAERAKGFVRPYRDAYRHVGVKPTYPTRGLTPDEQERYDRFGYVAFEAYPDDSPERTRSPSVTGRFWTQAQFDASGCGTVTTMGRALSETYARDPTFYGSTFCCGCNRHLPVEEFVWTADGQRVGS